MARHFRPYDLNQSYLLPPDLREWVPRDHLIWFISDVVDTLDVSAIYREYQKSEARGRAGYHPAMLVKLLVYAYCVGKPSSRKIEKATWEEVSFRVLAGDQHPDHDTIADFRKRHLSALAGLFVQVLMLCREAGLVKLGHVSLDGTKVKANASKHKAMSYERMCDSERQFQGEVAQLLRGAERVDEEEDRQYGKGRRGDELPKELAFRESRLKKIQEAKATLEREAREKAEREAKAARKALEKRQKEERKRGKKYGGRPPKIPDPAEAKPGPKEQKNFTDPESRIMVDGATKSFIQAYNAQAGADAESQVIVAALVTQQANDKRQFIPILEQVRENLDELPAKVTADSGYFSEWNITKAEAEGMDCYIPPAKNIRKQAMAKTMHEKLDTENGRAIYRMRKAIIEPVFGQIKEARGFRRFSFRGLQRVTEEWQFICLTHNLLKLFRAQVCPIST